MKITFDILRPHQKEILDHFHVHKATYIQITGGVGTFKTSTAMLGWYHHCMLYPGQDVYVIGMDNHVVERVWLNMWKRLFHEDQYRVKGGVGNREIVLPQYDSVFRLLQWTHPTTTEALKKIATGDNISGYHLLQPDMLSDEKKEFFGRIDNRVRLFSGEVDDPRQKRVFDLNAPYPGHWTHDLLFNENHAKYLGNREGRLSKIHIKTTVETSIYSQAALDNFLDEMLPHLYERFINGESVAAEGQVYKRYHFHKPITPNELVIYSIGFDKGEGEHPMGVIFVGKTKTGQWLAFDEIIFRDEELSDLNDILLKKCEFWGLDKADYMVYGWDGHAYKKYFAKHLLKPNGKMILSHAFPVGDRTTKWYYIQPGIDMMSLNFSRKELMICEHLELIQHDLVKYLYNDKGTKPDKTKYDPHLLDALRYVWIRIARTYGIW